MIENTKSRLPLLTGLFVIGVTITYLLQIAPAPVLSFIRDEYGLFGNDALLNLSMSVIFPVFIVCAAVGTWIEQRVGTSKLFMIAVLFMIVSCILLFFIQSYTMFLVTRVVYAVSFGLLIPFAGSAIMRWYKPKQREVMNTINGLFPWVGAFVAFIMLAPMTESLGGSWKMSIGMWGFIAIAIIVLWAAFINRQKINVYEEEHFGQQEEVEKGIYRNLWKRRQIKLLCGVFICDFFFYSYISALFPLFLMEAGNITEESAGTMAAFAFPAVGIVGTILGGFIASKSGVRRPIIATGQLLKVLGVIVMVFATDYSIWMALVGIALFTLGNSSYLPPFYMMPMELENMNPSRAAGAFSMLLSAGFIVATVSPVLGGALTNSLADISGIVEPIAAHVFGLKWSFFIFGFANVIAFIFAWKLKETGPGRKECFLWKKQVTKVLPSK
jgi:CP family cyanate transporter-like MFS transporter